MTPYTTGPVIATTLNTTLTSPTAYVSFAGIWANDGCGGAGTSIGRTIVAIPPDELFSTYSVISSTFIGPGSLDWEYGLNVGTASFNR